MPPSTPSATPTAHHLVAVWEARGERLTPACDRGAEARRRDPTRRLPGGSGSSARHWSSRPAGTGPVARRCPGILLDGRASGPLAVFRMAGPNWPSRSPGPREPWGVLHVVGETAGSLGPRDLEVARVAADALGAMVSGAQRADEVAHLLHRAEALRRVATDIGSRLDLDRILSGLVDHAMVLFEGDRAAVFLQHPDGHVSAEVTRNLSATFVSSVRDFPERSLSAAAVAALQPLFAVDYRNDPRGEDVRAAVVQEGFDTLCTAPLMDGTHLLGLLNIYHDRPHHWTTDELDTIGALATQASVAIQAAQDFERMATWAAQLQSIQQLGDSVEPAVERRRDRPVDRDRAAPAHRLPQRPRLPPRRRRAHPGRDAGPGRRIRRRDARPAARRARRGHHRLGRRAPGRADPRRRRGRSASRHHPGHGGRPRRIDAARADGVRRPGPRRPGPLEARPQQVHRRRPAAARHLRQLRRPGDGQRRHDRAAARADAGARAAARAASASSSRSPNRS